MNRESDFAPAEFSRKKHLPSIRVPVLVAVVAGIGNIIVVRAAAGAAPHLVWITLNQAFTTVLWVAAVWLGVLLAYREIVRWRS